MSHVQDEADCAYMCEYETDDLYIVASGKFEGEPRYIPHMWDLIGGGWFTEGEEDGVFTIVPDEDDIADYPELANVERIVTWQDNFGFVHSRVYTTP